MVNSKKIQGDAFERIVEASAELFAENAFHSVSVREIANKADVNISMISYYFGGKAGVLIEILNRFFDMHLSTIKNSIVEGDTPQDRLLSLLRCPIDKSKLVFNGDYLCWVFGNHTLQMLKELDDDIRFSLIKY